MAIEVSRNGATIGVGKLPWGKSHCLYYVEESVPGRLVTVAYFRSEADANAFLRVLCTATGIPQEELRAAVTEREEEAHVTGPTAG